MHHCSLPPNGRIWPFPYLFSASPHPNENISHLN